MEDEGNLLSRMRKIFSGEMEEGEDAAEAVMDMVDEGYRQGVFLSSEAQMIRNIFAYGEKDAKSIMTHRKHMVALDGEETLENALTFILEQNKSRFPVYEEDIDSIIGTIHLRDAMKCYFNEQLRHIPIKQLKEYIRPVSFIPETRSIDKLLKKMQEGKYHMAIVIDEYGQTAGLVTMEDIIEEIVGNIQDEYDEEEEEIVKVSDNEYLVEGSTKISDVNEQIGMTEVEDLEELLGIQFEEEDYETLNGFLIFHLERIPTEEENCVVSYEGYDFQVLSMENNIIKTVQRCFQKSYSLSLVSENNLRKYFNN